MSHSRANTHTHIRFAKPLATTMLAGWKETCFMDSKQFGTTGINKIKYIPREQQMCCFFHKSWTCFKTICLHHRSSYWYVLVFDSSKISYHRNCAILFFSLFPVPHPWCNIVEGSLCWYCICILFIYVWFCWVWLSFRTHFVDIVRKHRSRAFEAHNRNALREKVLKLFEREWKNKYKESSLL